MFHQRKLFIHFTANLLKTIQSNLHFSPTNCVKSEYKRHTSKPTFKQELRKQNVQPSLQSPTNTVKSIRKGKQIICAPKCITSVQRKKPAFRITQVTPADSDLVLNFLRRTFFVDEPMMTASNMTDQDLPELEQHCLEPLKEGLSLVAMDVNNRPLAIAINATINPGDGERLEKDAEVCRCKKTKELFKFWSYLEKTSQLWQRMNVSHMWEVRILATSFAARSYGLSKILLERSINMAREDCYPVVRVDCTSHYSAKAVESLDFYCLHSIRYKDYLGSNGKPVFPPCSPHEQLRMYLLPLIV